MQGKSVNSLSQGRKKKLQFPRHLGRSTGAASFLALGDALVVARGAERIWNLSGLVEVTGLVGDFGEGFWERSVEKGFFESVWLLH